MVKFQFIDEAGAEQECYIDENIQKNMDEIKNSVINKGFDYLAVVAGAVGVGKSTLTQSLCKYLDPSFSIDRVCFTADDFIEKTSKGTKGQAFMLDESFADLNSRMSASPDFIRITSHLQLIRQNNLFLFLVLPDFFSLSKNFAIFRASHLFVVYHEDYNRGRVAVFGRDKKRELYCKGIKFVDYQAVTPNFRSKFTNCWTIDFNEYEKRKKQHLIEQAKKPDKHTNAVASRNNLIKYLHNLGKTTLELATIAELDDKSIYRILKEND